MKKQILKIAALVAALALIAGVCVFANSLVGNPLSQALAKNTARKHIEKTYGNTDYELERVSYSFKDGYYYAYVTSPSNIDGDFTLYINGFGQLRYDNYDYNVANGWNTARRIDTDYRKTVDTMFESSLFPLTPYIAYGEIMFTTADNKDAPAIPDYALVTDNLIPNTYYNANELGAKAGKLTVYIDDNTVTAERMAQILLEIREYFDNAGVGFCAIDCVLEYPRDENGFAEDGRVEVMDFPYTDIYEDELVERVEASNTAAQEYYYTQDMEKLTEQFDEINE